MAFLGKALPIGVVLRLVLAPLTVRVTFGTYQLVKAIRRRHRPLVRQFVGERPRPFRQNKCVSDGRLVCARVVPAFAVSLLPPLILAMAVAVAFKRLVSWLL